MTYLWADFLIILLCLVFLAFILNVTNILNLLLVGELFWIIIFFFGLSLSLKYDSLLAFLFVIYTLVLATIETSVGLSLLIFKKYSSGSVLNFLTQDNVNYNIKKKKNFFFKKKVD